MSSIRRTHPRLRPYVLPTRLHPRTLEPLYPSPSVSCCRVRDTTTGFITFLLSLDYLDYKSETGEDERAAKAGFPCAWLEYDWVRRRRENGVGGEAGGGEGRWECCRWGVVSVHSVLFSRRS